MSVFTYFYFFVFLFFTHLLYAQPSKALHKHVNEIVADYMADKHTYGLAVGILERGYNYQYFYGNKDKNHIQLPDNQTLFRIGSITKTFTTSLLLAMAAQNVVKLQDTITTYLPDSIGHLNPVLRKITLEQLATHTSGLPRKPSNVAITLLDSQDFYAHYQLTDLYQFLIDYKPNNLPIKKKKRKRKKRKKQATEIFNYSHLGIGLLGHLLENATGMTYDSLLAKYIFQSLNLTNTYIQVIEKQQNKLVAGHHFNGTRAPKLHYASLYASEGLYSTVDDLLKYITAQMDTSQQNPYAFLKQGHVPHIQTPLKNVYVGYGWYNISRGKRDVQIITHSGHTGGYSCYIAFIEEKQTAVVVLSNSTKRIDELGIDILELISR